MVMGGGGGSGNQHELVTLNIGQRVTALAAGDMTGEGRDCLMVGDDLMNHFRHCSCWCFFQVGTPTNLLAYDVEENADIFHKVSDSVYKLHRSGHQKCRATETKLKRAEALNLVFP